MAKFPTEVEKSVTIKAPRAAVYDYLWDVAGSAKCIPSIDSCKRVAADTFCFVYEERSTGPVSLVVRYTCRYEGNGKDEITFESTAAKSDNTDVSGRIRLKAAGDGTKLTLWQRLAPETPVPSLLQGLIRSRVEKEAGDAVKDYLQALKKKLEERNG